MEEGLYVRRNILRVFALCIVLLSFILYLPSQVLHPMKFAYAQEKLPLDAKGAILMEMHNGKVLYEKNPDERLYPASTTKILTALVALENGNLDDTITVGKEVLMIPWDSSKALLKEGERLTLRELLMGLMLPSGNDAAMTIAVYIGRKVTGDMSLDEAKAADKFSQLMNDRAKKAGANNSNFINPHGYHDKDHYTTARDLALITREAMKYEFFREVVKTYKYNAEDKPVFNNGQVQETVDHIWRNTNELINESGKNYYEYATGVKTGYTTPAGQCVVSSASKDGMDLIAVVLGTSSQNRWEDSKKLLEYGFENYGYYKGIEKNQTVYTLYVDNHSLSSPENLVAVSDEDFAEALNKEDVPKIQKSITWDENLISPQDGQNGNVKLLSSVEANQIIGKVTFTLDGKVIKEINLKALESVEKQSFIGAAIKSVGASNIASFFFGMICGAMGILMLLRRAMVRRRGIRRREIGM